MSMCPSIAGSVPTSGPGQLILYNCIRQGRATPVVMSDGAAESSRQGDTSGDTVYVHESEECHIQR